MIQTLGTDGPLGPGVQGGSVQPGYRSSMRISGSVVLSVAQRIGGLGWRAEVAGTDEQEKGRGPISTAQGGLRPRVFSYSVDLCVPTTCSVTCQAPPACPQASVEPEQVGGCGPLAIGGRGELRRRPSWALWGAAQPGPVPLCGTGPA